MVYLLGSSLAILRATSSPVLLQRWRRLVQRSSLLAIAGVIQD